MKATVETMESESLIDRSAWSVFSDLVKVRLTSLVLLTTLAGFYLATTEGMQFVLLLHTMVGTALLACGSSVLNQYLERHHDSLMPRTESRPLPAALMHPERALWFGILLSITGCFYTWFLVNLLTCILGTLTLALYIFVYTPLKRLTSFNTVVGAIPGALPPLMGWTAVRGSLDAGGWSLFLILFYGSCLIFLPLHGCIRKNTEQQAMSCCPMLTQVARRRQGMRFCILFSCCHVACSQCISTWLEAFMQWVLVCWAQGLSGRQLNFHLL